MCSANVAARNYATMKVSILIGSRDRIEVLRRCLKSALAQNYSSLEILVLDDNSSQYRLGDLISTELSTTHLRCFRSDTSLGVAGGRNFLMQQASGDIYCFVDDDAYFADNDCITKLVNTFKSHPDVGIIATKIIDHFDQQTELAVPFSRRWRNKQPDLVDTPQLVSYYVGTCHAIDRRVIEQCGDYQHDLMYGEEELDLSYRAVENEFRLFYLPDVVVLHHPQPSVVAKTGRHSHPELYYHVRNRFFIARRYLPWPYIPVYLMTWLVKYGFEAAKFRAFTEYFGGLRAGIRTLRLVGRKSLTPQAVAYLQSHYGRLWY